MCDDICIKMMLLFFMVYWLLSVTAKKSPQISSALITNKDAVTAPTGTNSKNFDGGCDNDRLLRCGREFVAGLGMHDIPKDAMELLVQFNSILLREVSDGVLDICR